MIFDHEPDRFRPIPFYFINTADPKELTPDHCRRAMRDLAEAGFGGCVLFNKPPTGFDKTLYLSDLWFDTLENFIISGRDLGLEMWINDGFDYPPGDAAGRIEQRDPTLHQMRLRLDRDGKAEIVETPWGFPAFELPESSELFIEFVYEAHRRRLEKYFGNGLTGFFSDCDNRRINAHVIRELEDGWYFPWSRNFASEFEARRGYGILPHLTGILRGDADRQPTVDYWQTAGELYQAWFAANHAWCRAHGLRYTFHTSDTGPFPAERCRRTSLASEGDPFTLFRHSDFPGTDHEIALLDGGTHYDARYRVPVKIWGTPGRAGYAGFADTRYDVRAKYAASASYMQGAERTMCEMFAATDFGTDYQELRRIAAWQIMMGVNFIIPHAVHHRFFGETKFFAPPEFLHTPFRNGLREFNAFLAGFCRIASRGKYLAAVALLDPTRAVWSGNDAASENLFALCDKLNRSAAGYVIVTPEYLEDHRSDFALVLDPAGWDGTLDLGALPGGDVSFSGGELCFMRRRDDDGTEFLIAANLWSETELSGLLRRQDREYRLALSPGEYAVLGGACETFRVPLPAEVILTLTEPEKVTFDDLQRIPVECLRRTADGTEEFVWHDRGAVGPLALEWPAAFSGLIRCDGQILHGTPVMRFDDPYLRSTLPASASAPGEHRLTFTGVPVKKQPVWLAGAVDVTVSGDGSATVPVLDTYNLKVVAPQHLCIELAPRRTRLTAGVPLGEQGQVFYDGITRWHWHFTLPEKASWIDLGGTRGVCDVSLDGGDARRCIAEPYLLPVDLDAGEHDLDITLYGSPGALLEGGNAVVTLGVIRIIGAARTVR